MGQQIITAASGQQCRCSASLADVHLHRATSIVEKLKIGYCQSSNGSDDVGESHHASIRYGMVKQCKTVSK